MIAHHVVHCAVILLQGVLSARMTMDPVNAMVLPGQNISFLCQAAHPLLYCRITLPSLRNALSLSPRTPPAQEYAYHGSGLADGQCGVTLLRVMDKFSGDVGCSGASEEGMEESWAQTSLTVLRAPKAPELVVFPSQNSRTKGAFKEGDVLTASCVVHDGRPVANISWFLGDHLLTVGIKTETTTDPRTNLHTIKQVLHRSLGWRDDSKELRCVAAHPAKGANGTSNMTIIVTYPPRSVKIPIELYGFTINETGNVTVRIWANPRPAFVWIFGQSQLPEGQKYPGGNLEAMRAEFLGRGEWAVILHINKVTREDLDREYYLRATNSEGQRTYQIVLSSETAAPFKFGVGLIIATVVAAVLVLAVAVSVHVFVSGRRKRKIYSPTSEGMSQATVDAPPLII